MDWGSHSLISWLLSACHNLNIFSRQWSSVACNMFIYFVLQLFIFMGVGGWGGGRRGKSHNKFLNCKWLIAFEVRHLKRTAVVELNWYFGITYICVTQAFTQVIIPFKQNSNLWVIIKSELSQENVYLDISKECLIYAVKLILKIM